MHPAKPNFFIVGAPKCGTTSLYEHLRRHPDVYMPHSESQYWKFKEPYYFCEELIALPGLRTHNEAAYSSLFDAVSSEKCIGEATTLYLYSKEAPYRIMSFSPEAKIIIVLRDPVEMMMSWHHDCVAWGHENVLDFKKAILLESIRAKGQRLPAGSGYPSCLLYTRMASFGQQVKRYQDVFGNDAIKVCLLEDFQMYPEQTIAGIEDFLEIPRSNATGLIHYNIRRNVSRGSFIKSRIKGYLRAYTRWAKGFKNLVPPALKHAFQSSINHLDKPVSRPEINPAFLETLRARMRPDILALEQVINRDLSHWRISQHELVDS